MRPTTILSKLPHDPTVSMDDRERVLIEAVVSLAKSLRDERDHLAARVQAMETELNAVMAKLASRRARSVLPKD